MADTTKPKPLVRPITPQKVHAVLRKAGYCRSVPVFDCFFRKNWTSGYRVARSIDGLMRVAHYERYVGRDYDYQAAHAGATAGYVAALSAAGIPCRVEGSAVVVGGEGDAGS